MLPDQVLSVEVWTNRVLAIALLFLLLLGAVAGWGYLENARLVEKTVVLAEKNETLEVENETLQVVKVELSQEVEGLGACRTFDVSPLFSTTEIF